MATSASNMLSRLVVLVIDQIGTTAARPLLGLLAAPVVDAAVIAAEEDVWHLSTPKVSGTRVLRIFESIGGEALFLEGLAVAEHPGQQSDDCLSDTEGRRLASGKYVVADRDLAIDPSLSDALVDPLVSPAHQDEIRGLDQFFGHRLVERLALGRQQDAGSVRRGLSSVLESPDDRSGLHDHAGAPSIGAIVGLAMLVVGEISNVEDVDLDVALSSGTSEDARLQRATERFGKECQNVDLHRASSTESMADPGAFERGSPFAVGRRRLVFVEFGVLGRPAIGGSESHAGMVGIEGLDGSRGHRYEEFVVFVVVEPNDHDVVGTVRLEKSADRANASGGAIVVVLHQFDVRSLELKLIEFVLVEFGQIVVFDVDGTIAQPLRRIAPLDLFERHDPEIRGLPTLLDRQGAPSIGRLDMESSPRFEEARAQIVGEEAHFTMDTVRTAELADLDVCRRVVVWHR
jgi:hypothetical protein